MIVQVALYGQAGPGFCTILEIRYENVLAVCVFVKSFSEIVNFTHTSKFFYLLDTVHCHFLALWLYARDCVAGLFLDVPNEVFAN